MSVELSTNPFVSSLICSFVICIFSEHELLLSESVSSAELLYSLSEELKIELESVSLSKPFFALISTLPKDPEIISLMKFLCFSERSISFCLLN